MKGLENELTSYNTISTHPSGHYPSPWQVTNEIRGRLVDVHRGPGPL